MDRVQKAYERLKELAMFCETYEQFEAMFFQGLQEGKEREAMVLVLQAAYKMLTSDGERYNDIIARADEATRTKLAAWLEQTYKKVAA